MKKNVSLGSTLRIFVVFCLLMAYADKSLAQGLSITGTIDRSEIQVGEPAAIDLVVRTNDPERTRINVPQDTLVGFTLLAYQPIDTVVIDNVTSEIHARILITAWDAALLSVPPITVYNGEEEASAGPFVLKVTEPEVDLTKPDSIADIKDPWALPYTFKDVLKILFGNPYIWIYYGLALLAILIWLYRSYRKRQIAMRPATVDPPIPFIVQSLSALSLLEENIPKSEGAYKPYYTELVDLLRRYLHNAAGIDAGEKTSAELCTIVADLSDGVDGVAELEQVLEESDLVKFARAMPNESDIRATLSDARDFLIKTDIRLSKKVDVSDVKKSYEDE